MKSQIKNIAKTVILLALLLSSCQPEKRRLRLATTTTTYDSGLMDTILPAFEEEQNVEVDVIVVGTGEALALGRAGDVDVVLVHARNLEDEFIAEGYGINRRDVMYNDFVLLGPDEDPAGVKGMADVVAALVQIEARQTTFISRGDNSGTHLRERLLWEIAGINPDGDWYQEIGQGMGSTLTIADEQKAYTLSDRGTFIVRQVEGIELTILVEGDDRLVNPYGVIAVNPELHEDIEVELARQFIDWITSAETQKAINGFKINGQQLFFGNTSN